MAESNANLELKTPFGTIVSQGATVFVVVAMSVFTGIALWKNYEQHQDHTIMSDLIRAENELTRVKMEALICTNRLNLYFQTLPKGKELSWQDVPQEYWSCLPKNLLDRTIR